MSVYRTLIAAVAALSLATAVFAEENAAPAQNAEQPQAMQVADASSAQPAEQVKVDINKATAKELMKVKGLNAAKARAIVAYRKKNGDFKTLDDLKQVKGFKKMDDANLKEIQNQLTLG